MKSHTLIPISRKRCNFYVVSSFHLPRKLCYVAKYFHGGYGVMLNAIRRLCFTPSLIYCPLLITQAMELTSAKLSEITALFRRLQEAKKQVEVLHNEIATIKNEITKVENLSVFQQIQKSSFKSTTWTSNAKHASDGTDYPSAKRVKYDFPMEDGYVIVYTDGACENNGKAFAKAGIGVWFTDNHPLNISEPVKGKATNNVAEIQACIKAVEIARDHDIKKLKIITDSQFTINSMTKWIKGWKKKNWKLADGKSDVKNKTDFMKLDNLCKGLDIQWVHVRGHVGIKGNEMADQLAQEGAKQYRAP